MTRAQRPRLDRGPFGVRASACVVVLMGAIVAVWWWVSASGGVTPVDRAVTDVLVGHRSPLLDRLAFAVTDIFGPVETGIAAAGLAALVAYRFRCHRCGTIVFGTVGVASATCWIIKLAVERPRPPLVIQETIETDFSFPSGHVTGTTALFGMAIVAAALAGHAAAVRWTSVLTVVFVVAVALSRMYLGVHWVTDVVAGALLGCSAAVIGGAVVRRVAATARTDRAEIAA